MHVSKTPMAADFQALKNIDAPIASIKKLATRTGRVDSSQVFTFADASFIEVDRFNCRKAFSPSGWLMATAR